MNRNHNALLGMLLSLTMPCSIALAQEEGATDPAAAITAGKASVSGRYRYEHVDQDNALDDANASTLRLRLNYRTGQWNGWSGFAEYDHVFHVLVDDFDSGGGTTPGRDEYSVVADPEGSDLNQVYLDYNMDDDWEFRFGRQRILLDNQRFVGGVGWRQNEQTYDALTLHTRAIAKTALSYSYIANVRRIFGQTVSPGKARLDGHLFNANVSLADGWSLVPYLYSLDYNDIANAASSTLTVGARLTGGFKAGDGQLALAAELARQSDAGDNPANYDADYLHVNGQWTAGNGLSLAIGFESLGGSTVAGEFFRTPLATLHGFNGWADQFLTTPTGGLDDLYASVTLKAGKWSLTGVYHDFSSETGGTDYGQEFDVSAARNLGERYALLLKGAFFNADSSSPSNVDTNKIWIMLTANY